MQQNLISEIKSKDHLMYFVCFSVFFSICFVPYIPIKTGLSLRVEDLLLPLVFFLIFPAIKRFKQMYFVFLAIWGVWALVSMAVNGRISILNDYFELYKLFKFYFFIVLFWMFFQLKPNIFKWVSSFFIVAVFFNLFHYFNLFHFNEIVMPIYCPNLQQLDYFGRNSLGGPATKRILGTMGNPNINAIFFSLFMIYFMPFLRLTKMHLGKILFYVSVAMLLLTQSRTGIAAFFIVYLSFLYLVKPSMKQILLYSALLFFVTVIVFYADQFSMNYITDAKWNIQENGSLRGRIEVWGELLKMVADSPIFGFGINKNYFYEHKIYSENEYILMLWRYGIPGLFFYFVMLFGFIYQFKDYIFKNLTNQSLSYLLGVIIIAVNAITNNPVSNPMILIMFAMLTGYFLSQNFPEQKAVKNKLGIKFLSWMK